MTDAAPPRRKLGPVLATLLVAGNMVGSGVYLLPATLASIGSASVIGWVVAAAGALLLAAVFAMLARVRPSVDGLVEYPSAGLGRFFGFQAGFAYWLSCWVGNGAIAVAAAGYLAVFLPVLKQPGWSAAGAVALIWALTLINLAGARFVGKLAGVTLAAGLAPIVVAVVFGWANFDPEVFRESWNVTGEPLVRTIPASLALVFWAYLGLECATVAAAVVREPERNVPIAAIGGVALATVVYISATTAIMGVIPAAELARSTAPFADVTARLLGPGAGLFVAACALLKAAGALTGFILVGAQAQRSAAAAGVLPRRLARVEAVPVAGLLVLAALMTAATLLSVQPTLGAQFGVLINVTVVLTLVVYAYCCVALLRFNRNGAARAVAVLALLFCVGVVAASDPALLAATAGVLTLAAPLYWARRRRALTASPVAPS